MVRSLRKTLWTICLAATAAAIPLDERSTEEHDGVVYNVIRHAATGSKLSFVKNSGICETTPGVDQYSGYISVGEDANMWFWFFESRENPKTAPLVSWFGGGPGNSALYGLFTQNGPCEIQANSTEPTLREHSINSYANVLYIDQPIGTGFSFGSGGKVNSTKDCSPYVWQFFQAWFDAFPEYENNDLAVFSESYGGHTGPEIVNYILDKNEEIEKGNSEGKSINVVALSASNAWFDARIQEKANLDFARSNSYRSLINESLYQDLLETYKAKVIPSLDKCEETGTKEDCWAAYLSYLNGPEQSIIRSAVDKYPGFVMADIRAGGLRPPTNHIEYLQRADVQKAIGAKVNFTDSGGAMDIVYSGDAGVQVVIWSGDSDYVCNWLGTLRVANAVDWPQKKAFSQQELQPYTVETVEKGTFKSVGNLHYARIYEGGHNVWWYQPEASVQILKQLLGGEGLFST